MDDARFQALMSRVRDGQSAAAAELLREFELEVRLMVRARLPRALRSRFDSMDFVQAVWKSVFTGNGRTEAFAGSDQFRGYLEVVTRNKVLHEFRKGTTKKFDIHREEPLYVRRNGSEAPRELAGPDPTPSQVVQADDCWDKIVAGRSALDIEIVRLRRMGLTFEEIAERTGLSDRTVRRVIDHARRTIDPSTPRRLGRTPAE
jgi:RNA polymerase sigma-70 factor (ECF subfamily)